MSRRRIPTAGNNKVAVRCARDRQIMGGGAGRPLPRPGFLTGAESATVGVTPGGLERSVLCACPFPEPVPDTKQPGRDVGQEPRLAPAPQTLHGKMRPVVEMGGPVE